MTTGRWASGLVLAAMGMAVTIGSATAETWPGPAPCNGTLQACVDAVASEATIAIATNGPIAESVTVNDKFLTIEAAPGFVPVFTSGLRAQALVATAQLSVHRLSFDGGTLVGLADNNHSVGVRAYDSTFVVENHDAISAFADNASAVNAEAHGCHFTVVSTGGNEGSAVQLANTSASSNFLSVTDNVITIDEGDGAGAISLYSTTGRVTIEVARNDIRRTGHNRGVFLRMDDADEFFASVTGNLIVGPADESVAAIDIQSPVEDADMSIVLEGNTLATGQTGISLNHAAIKDPTLFGGSIVNNILVAYSTSGLAIPADQFGNFDIHHNLFWNATASGPLGPTNLNADPLFVGGANYRLTANSPARDSGTSEGVFHYPDLDGNQRGADGGWDMGAYEYQAIAIEVPTLSTWGVGVMVGLLAVVGAWRMRR
jgi:hypothetical protein